MPEIDNKLLAEWDATHERYLEEFGETFASFGVVGRPDAMRTAIREMKAALAGERGPVQGDELGQDVPEGAAI